MKTWICADWHLGERRMDLLGRPFASSDEMIDTLVANHNAIVGPDDNVIMAGDVCYSETPEAIKHVERFNGKKVLIRGNHDRVFTDDDLYPYFVNVWEEGDGFGIEVPDANKKPITCYVTHYPTQGMHGSFNLVGHVHSAWKYQLNMLNIGVDVHHFRPVPLDKIPFHFTAICDFYDEDVWVGYNTINKFYENKRGKKGRYFTPAPKTTCQPST